MEELNKEGKIEQEFDKVKKLILQLDKEKFADASQISYQLKATITFLPRIMWKKSLIFSPKVAKPKGIRSGKLEISL